MQILCPNCNSVLPEDFLRQTPVSGPCPSCTAGLDIAIFPALFRERLRIDTPNLAAAEGEGCCYEHGDKKASAICSKCGRFLCSLCEVEVDSKTWCPHCLMPGNLPILERRRTLYDSIALGFATLPMLLGYLGLLGAPVVFYLAIRHWKTPSSIVPRSKWRFVLALGIAGFELAAFFIGIGTILFFISRGEFGRK